MTKPMPTKPTKPTIRKPYLEFKFNQVVMLGDLGDGVMHSINIPTTMEQVRTPLESRMVRNPSTGRLESRAEYVTQPTFNLDHVHRIELANELAVLPKRLPGMSDAHYSKLADGCYERAAAAKEHNDRIRQRVAHYCETGVLTLVSDPFEGETEVEGTEQIEQSAAAIQAEQEVEAPKQTVKPKPRNRSAKAA